MPMDRIAWLSLPWLAALAMPANAQQDRRPISADLPAECVFVLDGSSLSGFAHAVDAFYEDAMRRLDAPYRGLASLLIPFVSHWLGQSPATLGEREDLGDWAFAVVARGGRHHPIVVVRGVGDAAPKPWRSPKVAMRPQDGVLCIAADAEACDAYHAWRARGRPSLADRQGFADSRSGRGGANTARVFVDLDRLRRNPPKRSLQPFTMLAAGPLITAVDAATRADGAFSLDATGLAFELAFDATVLDGGPRAALLAHGASSYEVPTAPECTVGSVQLDRSLAGFWTHLDTLLTDVNATKARAFLSLADQLLAGSLVDDLVPSLGAPVSLYVLDVTDDDAPETAVDLPGFVAVAERRTDEAEKLLTNLFATAVTIQRFEAVQNNKVGFFMRRQIAPGGESMLVGEPTEWREPGLKPIAAALSPTIAFADDHIVFGSTRAATEAMLASLASDRPSRRVHGDGLRLEPARAAAWVRRNLRVLVLDRVLDEGMSQDEAKRDLSVFADALEVFESLAIDWRPAADSTRLEVRLELSDV